MVFLYLSLIPLFYVVISLTFGKPSGVQVLRSERSAVAIADKDIGMKLSLSVGDGVGIVSVADALPEHFELAEGNNFHVYWKGRAPLSHDIEYTVRCTKRGIYDIGPVNVESIHHSWLEQAELYTSGDPTKLTVKLKPISLKKMRDPRLLSKMPMPMGALSRLGMKTSDFLELRSYTPGDPYRSINWKATARISAAGGLAPLVNEYEKEGKKSVHIFVDAGAWMGLGSNVENVFEYALQAASGIASFYLDRDVKVGVHVYHCGESVLPDTGRKQAFDIKRRMLEVQVSEKTDPKESLKMAVHECQGHLPGSNPLFIVITMVNKNNAKELIEGVRSMRWFATNSKLPRVIVVHIAGYDVAASDEYESAAANILDMGTLPHMKAVRKAGAFVIPWNPRTQTLNKLMVVGFKRR